MKLEAIETTTLYISVPAGQLGAVREHDWREIPDPGDEVVLRSAPDLFCTGGPSIRGEFEGMPGAGIVHVVLRLQVRVDFIARIALRPAGEWIEARLSPSQIQELNHNLVGPLSVECVLAVEESACLESPPATTPSEGRIPVMC